MRYHLTRLQLHVIYDNDIVSRDQVPLPDSHRKQLYKASDTTDIGIISNNLFILVLLFLLNLELNHDESSVYRSFDSHGNQYVWLYRRRLRARRKVQRLPQRR